MPLSSNDPFGVVSLLWHDSDLLTWLFTTLDLDQECGARSVGERSEGMTVRHDEAGQAMHVIIVNPQVMASYTVTGVSQGMGGRIMAHTETDGEPVWTVERMTRAVAAVTGTDVQTIS